MPQSTLRTAAFVVTAGLSLASCSTYGYGGYGGYGYDNQGYGNGVSIGVSTGSYWGWNDGFYYPGTGYYVYDSYRRPHAWNQRQQAFWTGRQSGWRNRGEMRTNWDSFGRHRHRR